LSLLDFQVPATIKDELVESCSHLVVESARSVPVENLERLGCSKSVVALVGARPDISFHLDASQYLLDDACNSFHRSRRLNLSELAAVTILLGRDV